MQSIDNILEERGQNYGSFVTFAELCQQLKELSRETNKTGDFSPLSPTEREAFDMILHKICRIINGNELFLDSWVDIVGYTKLALNQIEDSGRFPHILDVNKALEYQKICLILTKLDTLPKTTKTKDTLTCIFSTLGGILTCSKPTEPYSLWNYIKIRTQQHINELLKEIYYAK